MTEDGWSGSIANRFHLVARSPLALSDPLLLWQIMWLFFHAQRGFGSIHWGKGANASDVRASDARISDLILGRGILDFA